MKTNMRRLFLDIETSPNIVFSWRIGGKVYLSPDNILQERAIICACWKWEGAKEIGSLSWKDGDDKALLQKLASVVAQADEVIGHNLDKFDLPWIRTRAIKHEISIFELVKTIDTYKLAARLFNFNSNRLDYLGEYLEVGKKIKTEYQWWKDVCRGDKKRLKDMVTYCKQDVTLLEKVFHRLMVYAPDITHAGLLSGGVRADCPKCASANTIKRGSRVTTATKKAIMSCNDCGRNFTVPFTTKDTRVKEGRR